MNTKLIHDSLIEWIKEWFEKNGKNANAVVGISGGKDSTVCAALLAEALGKDRVIGVMMPNGIQTDINDSKKVCELLGIKSYEINIDTAFNSLTDKILTVTNALDNSKNLSQYVTNTPARIRMVTLYGVASIVNGRVCNTCNASESVVGWETYGGDGFGDFSPLGRMTVSEVLELGDYMKLPKELVYKTPSDGMCGASDEDKMGFTYSELDSLIRNDKIGEHYDKIVSMNKASHFKHENIHIPTFDMSFHFNEIFNW